MTRRGRRVRFLNAARFRKLDAQLVLRDDACQ
jgi:hypothetical protein